jgi:hypothetical protein
MFLRKNPRRMRDDIVFICRFGTSYGVFSACHSCCIEFWVHFQNRLTFGDGGELRTECAWLCMVE